MVRLFLQRFNNVVKNSAEIVTSANVRPVSAANRPARLKDVAGLAGVSVKTVSNVVNDYPFVRDTTRSRVEKAIAELNYRPNVTARNLRSGRTGVIGLAVPDLAAPYFAELAHYVVDAALERKWTVLVDETGQTDDSALRQRERHAAAGIQEHMIDGVILSPLALNEDDIARYGSVPLVLLGERLGSHLADHVAIDNQSAAEQVTKHLVDLGRRRIAVIGAQSRPYGHTARLRLQGYRAALKAAGLRYDRSLVLPAQAWRRETGQAAVHRLLTLADPPDALFCFNDQLALGAMRGLYDAGVQVPDDIAVVGFDDIEESRFSIPSLSSVAPDKVAIAAQAVACMAQRLERGSDWQPQEITVGHQLCVRESSGR